MLLYMRLSMHKHSVRRFTSSNRRCLHALMYMTGCPHKRLSSQAQCIEAAWLRSLFWGHTAPAEAVYCMQCALWHSTERAPSLG
jgi:hypothetical protein